MKLFFRQQGEGQPLIILHGFLGSSDNWHSLARQFAQQFSVYIVDQRNHGQSPHSDVMNYQAMTEDLEEFMRDNQIENANLIGHSMGGKTVMNYAVKNPSKVNKLIVVDIVPKYYPVRHDREIAGMKAIPLDELTNRQEAEVILSGYEPDAGVRQFLLKNLARTDEGKFYWRPNLEVLDKNIDEVGQGMKYEGTFNGETLFINGDRSKYYVEGDDVLIKKIFPKAQFTLLDTGHWVQAEKPQEFIQTALQFLNGK